MTDAVTQTDDQPVDTQQPAAEPTLDDVYKSVQFDQPQVPAQQPAAPLPIVQQPHQPAAPSSVPDPYDSEAFKAYMARQGAETSELKQALSNTVGFLTGLQRQEAIKAMDADIQAAVKVVGEVAGIDKPKVVEAWLDGKAREDARFKQLWDNRSKNPAAWNNALKAVAREMQKDFSVQVDPKLAAAQQVRRISQSQMATTQQDDDKEPDWASKTGSDFEAGWNSMVNRGH